MKGLFNTAQVKEINRSGLAKVMCTQLEKSVKTTQNPFIKAYKKHNGVFNDVLSCGEIGSFDFSAWKEEGKPETPAGVHDAECHTNPKNIFPLQNAEWSCSKGPG